jgi:hypothetical protein
LKTEECQSFISVGASRIFEAAMDVFPLEILAEFARHMDFDTLRKFALICAPFLAASKILDSQLIHDKKERRIVDRVLRLDIWEKEKFQPLSRIGQL